MTEDPMDDLVVHPLLGKKVRVQLYADVWLEGTLDRISVSGDVDLRQDDGTVIYAWPALEIEPVPPTG